MQKFTRSLTREIEISGERVAITLDDSGITLRPVGSRRPPYTLSWASVIFAATTKLTVAADQLAGALTALKQGAEKEATLPSPPPAPAASPPPATPAPSGLSAVLARIDAWFAKYRAGFHGGLLPGASAADLDALTAAIGGSLPDELRTLLQWHNGQNPDVYGAFERNFFLLSAEQIATTKKELAAEPRNGWKPGMVPWLDDDQDDYVCLDTTKPGTPVVECWRGQTEAVVTAPSLAAWLEGFAAALEKGEYFEDPERGSLRRKS